MTLPTLDEARIRKELAETAKFEAETKAALAQAEMNAAEARRTTALARKEEFYAENARIGAEDTRRAAELKLAGDHYHHEFHFNFDVTDESVEVCTAQLRLWHRQSPNCAMLIKLDSPGGSFWAGMHLFDEISAYSLREWDTRDIPKGNHRTTVVARGMAASMGGILLQAADHRVCGPETHILIHEIQTLVHGRISEIKEDTKFWDKATDRVADIFARRSGGKMTRSAFKRKWGGREWWIPAEEALELGFVDQIA